MPSSVSGGSSGSSLPRVVGTSEKLSQTGDIGATTLVTPTSDGTYEVKVYAVCTTAGGGTLNFTLSYTDDNGAQSIDAFDLTTATDGFDLSVDGIQNISQNGAAGQTILVFRAVSGNAISYTATIANKTGNPVYNLYVYLVQIA